MRIFFVGSILLFLGSAIFLYIGATELVNYNRLFKHGIRTQARVIDEIIIEKEVWRKNGRISGTTTIYQVFAVVDFETQSGQTIRSSTTVPYGALAKGNIREISYDDQNPTNFIFPHLLSETTKKFYPPIIIGALGFIVGVGFYFVSFKHFKRRNRFRQYR